MLHNSSTNAKIANRGKISLVACLLLSKSVMAQVDFITRGLGFRNTTSFNGIDQISLMGGSQVFIRTSGGLDENPQLNQISLTCKNIPQTTFVMPPISDDDAFSSDPALGKLAWTIPPAADIFSSPVKHYSYFDFNNLPGGLPGAYPHPSGGIDYLTFDIDVASPNFIMNCTGSAYTLCSFQYNQRFTPEIYDVSPNQVTAEDLINIHINPLQVSNSYIPFTWEVFEDIKIGDRTTDWEGRISQSFKPPQYRISQIGTRVGDNRPSKSVDPDVNWALIGRSFIRETSKHCNFAGDDCWKVRVHPKIEKISASSGFLTGGQVLEVTGFGLSGQEISVKVDGVACLINYTLSTDTSIICETGSKMTPSLIGVPQPGNFGVTHTIFNSSDPQQVIDWDDIKSNVYPTTKSLKTSLETIKYVYDDKSAHSFDGWFYAPETGQYKFYLSADDHIRFYMDISHPYSATVPYTQDLYADANLQAYCFYFPTWRQYEKPPAPQDDPLGKYQSDWLNLEGGKYYKFAYQHIDYLFGQWSIGSVEFTKPGFNAVDHPKASKAIQNLRIETNPSQAEQWTITCNNVSSSSTDQFILSLTSPNSSTVFKSQPILCRSGADEVYSQIKAFFNDCTAGSYNICSEIAIFRTMYTSTGVETTIESLATKFVFDTYLKKRINGPSFISYQVIPVGTITSTVTVTPPYAGGVLSSGPISGSFKISCSDPQGTVWTTRANAWNLQNAYIQANMDEDIPWLRGKVLVHIWTDGQLDNLFKFSYRENGVNIYLTFDGLHSDPPLCTIISDTVTPMAVSNGGTFAYYSEWVRHYGSGLMFEPVSLEFMRTDALNPQVMVKVDGLEALCTQVNCDYEYVQNTGVITSQSYDSSTKVIQIQGTGLPTTGLLSSFGGSTCNNTPAPIITATLIECTLIDKPSAGAHNVELKTSQGLIQIGQGVSAINIPLIVNTVSPAQVNPLGGAVLTFSGEGFPSNADLVSVNFSDGTICVVKSSSYFELVCRFSGFSNNDGASRTITINVRKIINDNGIAVFQTIASNSSQTLGSIPILPSVVSIDKTNVPPTLKQTLTFTLDAAYTDNLVANELRVELRQAASNYSRELYIMSVDNSSPKKFTVKFNGAPIGSYTFYVESNSPSQYGQLNTAAISIQTESIITNLSPVSGSVLGGTVLTITGTNFSSTISDQVVKVGEYYCDILTASPTQLTCRIRNTNRPLSSTSLNNEVALFFAADSYSPSQKWNDYKGEHGEAKALCEVLCMFEFKTPQAKISTITPAFNPATNNIELTVVGTGFQAGQSSEISLLIDGKPQNLKSVNSDTSVVFTLGGIEREATSSIVILFQDGLPENYQSLSPITFTPSFAKLYPNSGGSFGGTLLTISAPGIGVKTRTVNLFSEELNKNICSETIVTGYGTFTCLTSRGEIKTTDTLKVVVGTLKYDCANSDPLLCKYSQIASGQPQITGAIRSNNIITFSGSSLPSSASFTLKAIYQSMEVSITSWTATQVVATFPLGIPANTINVLPKLAFTRIADSVVFYATFSASANVQNPLTVTAADSTSNLSVSYAGGLMYTVTKVNAYATLLEKANRLEICGNICKPIDTLSDINQVTCTLPALATSYSVSTYQYVKPNVLSGTWTASSASQVLNVIDGIFSTEYVGSGASNFIQLAFPEGQLGVLDSAKVLINGQLNSAFFRTPFLNSVLQGFDGTNYVDLWRLDQSISQGWNTKNFADGSKPAYSAYRWSCSAFQGCRFGEVIFTGIIVKPDTASSTQCTAKLFIGTASQNLSTITYSAASTPKIDSIEPRYGKVTGNEVITITGENFVDGATTVTIDKITCVIQSVTATQIKCLTGQRIGDETNPSFEVFVTGRGLAVNQGNTFSYAQYWSESSTWGNDAPPQFGEAVFIPQGRTLLVDVDKVPQLSFVLVEGALIFTPHSDPTHIRAFDAGYIFIKGGYMEVGTEEHPYTSKLTITMHGDLKSPANPTFGNKNIAVMQGTLSMVGQPRPVVWTLLDSTVLPNATQITLMPQDSTFDWAVGEQIVIAATGYSKDEAEVRTIVAVGSDAAKPVLTLDRPLIYKHYAATETFDPDFIDVRAEVGLLTRNVKFRGDPETSAKNQYGAHIMLQGDIRDESAVGKIMYIELTDVGQAFKLGRYPINFHMLGRLVSSIVKGNSIHQTYNRGIAVHAVSQFRIIQNVIYNAMGHTIFIQDGIETKNIIDGNLVIKTNRSWSLLNTDTASANFWITNPDNTIINNRAAGSDRYGFWFDLHQFTSGASFTNTICPVNTSLGEFKNNVSHSNQRHGLRIHQNHNPRTFPCSPLVYNNSNPSAVGAPYPSNPVIFAVYQDFTSWKNVENGAITEKTGAVIWKNFKVADNLLSGMEWSTVTPEIITDGFSLIDGALVIGKSQNTEQRLDDATPHGIIGPRTEWFTVQNVKFSSFGFINGAYALGDCSRCQYSTSTDSGARTITVRGLQFDSTVTRRIRYQIPYRGIFFDADGSLTGRGAGSWASANFKHNEQLECQTNLSVYDGQICDNTVEVRRIAFHGVVPRTIINLILRVAKFDDAVMAELTSTQRNAYKLDLNNYSEAPMTRNRDPTEAWALPYVTGHKYRQFFDAGQLDIKNIKIEVSPRWQPTDKYLLLNLPYTTPTEHIDVYRQYNQVYATSGSTGLIPDDTLQQSNYANWESGFNFNDNGPKREFNIVITGNPAGSKTLQINVVSCRDNIALFCAPPISSCTGTTKLWSDHATWPSGVLPMDGDNVTIPSGEIIFFDLEESPILNQIKVDGCLEFRNTGVIDLHLKAYQIFVSSGKFNIGSSTTPFSTKAKITLYGPINSSTVTTINGIEGGNKLIVNNGEVKMYGLPRSRMTRLLAEAQKGATTVTVETGLDWVEGDMLGFAATGLKHKEAESATILSYNSATGILVLTAPLEFYHFGRAVSTAQNYQGLDMRGEVILLTRNIIIQGDSTQNDWQGQFVTSDAVQVDTAGNTINLQGLTTLKNVEFNNMGQLNSTKAALRFQNSQREGSGVEFSTVQNSVFHHNGGFAISVVLSKNVSIQDCDIFHAKQIGVNIDGVTNVHLDSVNVFDVRQREVIESPNFADKETCVAFCTYTDGTNCLTSSYTNSIIGGCPFAGILTQGYSCTDPVGESSTTVIKDLVIHSVDGSGASFLPNPAIDEHKNCYQFSHISAYKNRGGGIGNMYLTLEMRASNIILVDNQLGITLNISGPEPSQRVIKFSDSAIYGENNDLSNDCPDPASGAVCYCPDKYGFMNFYGQLGQKTAHIQLESDRPIYNVKTDAIWDTQVELNNIDFINFKSTATACNAKQSAFGISPGYSVDQIPIHRFFNTKFENVHPNAIAYMKDPLPQWASIDNCGLFPCTGWSNVVINFYDTVFEVSDGVTPLPTYWTAGTTAYDFQIIGKVTAAGESYTDCSFNPAMNAYFCADPDQELPPQIGVLVFESLDTDSRTRTVSPVTITNENGYENIVNSFKDHAWVDVSSSQNRLSRFVAHVQTGLYYTVTYTGTPPKNKRYTLRSDVNTSGVTIKVPYPEPGSYDVLVDGNLIIPQPWDTLTKQQAVINPATAVCGSNRYVGIQDYLEFFVTPGCTVFIRPRDAILMSVRLQCSLDEFFSNCGVTSFIQKLASLLQIDPSRVEIVGVYDDAGSVKVETQILQSLQTVEIDTNGSVIPTEAAYYELSELQDNIDLILVPTSTSGVTTENILCCPIQEVQTEIIAGILGNCDLKQEQCPQSWPIMTGKGFDMYKCIPDKTLSLNWSGSGSRSGSRSGSSGSSDERCNYIALPDLDALNCKCVCNQDPEACPAATPYFDPSQCKCVCPYKDKCKPNWIFKQESCSCVCNKVDEGCPANKPTLDKDKCKCECKLSEDKCPRAYPKFDETTCSCKCTLSPTICAQEKKNKRFDQATCACRK